MEFEDQVCVVTGGASGIGAAICAAFAQAGATVAVLDIDRERAELFAATLPRAFALACDVASSAAVDAGMAEVVARHGRLDVLVNNAGIIGETEYRRAQEARERQITEAEAGLPRTPLRAAARLTDAQWRAMIDTHLTGTFYCCRAALAQMERQSAGVIVNMSSITGIDGGIGNPHYAAAKAGILGFTRALAKEAIVLGIRVNAVAPGFVETPLRRTISAAVQRAQIAATPIGRAATAEEIAATVLFLASGAASYYVGETFNINGGYLTV